MPLRINEIYFSIQGESTHAGRPCIFIRLTYCNIRCSYCDTEYAFQDGNDMEISEILDKIKQWDCNLVEVTGGEPLFQDECSDLLKELIQHGYEVLLETGGSLSVKGVPREVIKIVDFKCPSSGMTEKNLWSIIDDLMPFDEVKFVIGDREDFDWAGKMLDQYSLSKKCVVLFSPIFNGIDPSLIANWILEDNLPVRMHIQMHKHIWGPDTIGVQE